MLTFGDIAKRYGVYVAVGLPEFDPVTNQYFNSSAFIGPDGMVLGSYRKRNSLIEASYNAVATGPVPTFDTKNPPKGKATRPRGILALC
ncbi:nitrilase-related carbon-nitrogen hydrolase [Rhizobium mongolense]